MDYGEKDFVNEELKATEFTKNAKDTTTKKCVSFLINDMMEGPITKKDSEKRDEFISDSLGRKQQQMKEQGSDTISTSFSCRSNNIYDKNIRSHFSSSSDESSCEDLMGNDNRDKDKFTMVLMTFK